MAAGTVPDLKPKSRTTRYVVTLGLVALALLAGWMLGGGRKVKEEVAYVAGMEEYVYGYPLVMMDVTREVLTATSNSGEFAAPINQFARIRETVGPSVVNVVRISVNSLWSHEVAWFPRPRRRAHDRFSARHGRSLHRDAGAEHVD
jgi:hypothetical protein